MSESTMATVTTELTGERADLLQVLSNARHFLRFTARDLTDDQARTRTTVSELTVGGLIKHVTSVEEQWRTFILHGKAEMDWDGADFASIPPDVLEAFAREFRTLPEETLDELLAHYAETAARTDEVLADVDLDTIHELPKAPWFTDATWSVRRALLHIVAETAQHSGHADIIRESLDGAKSMG
ncbi:DinB family protein [Ruania halotolerans]|uniref:DinB family protein n=1 Tax=Ruania halotolerans TaxID=2897773 RepID=UPI001E558AA7|nr:DinB family protein [Ruania halotolerans]UFU06784.1 DinB family protein [Ruania halotolerans]